MENLVVLDGTLRSIIKRAKLICSDKSLVKEEIKYLTKVFHKVSDYPISITNAIAKVNIVKVKIKEQKLTKFPIKFS